MIDNILDLIFANYLNLSIAVVIVLSIVYALFKRLFSIALVAITIFIIYCSILVLNNQPIPTVEEITDQLSPSEETQDAIKDGLKDTEKELKKRFEKLQDSN